MNISDRIQALRKAKGMSQELLSEKLDISVKHLSTLETGKGFVSAELLEKICDVLLVSPAALFYSPEEKSVDDSELSKIEHIIEEQLNQACLITKQKIHKLKEINEK